MAVREGLLALLSDGPQLGYQLKTAFDATTGGVWALNVGQVYTTLDRLHRDGLVHVDDDEGQKRYSLTPAGRAQLGGWWEAVPAEDPPPRDELLLKVLFAIPRGRDHALSVITRQRTALTLLLQERRRATGPGRPQRPPAEPGRPQRPPAERPSDADADVAAALVADSLAVRAEADLRWLDLCEARVLRMHPEADVAAAGVPGRTRR